MQSVDVVARGDIHPDVEYVVLDSRMRRRDEQSFEFAATEAREFNDTIEEWSAIRPEIIKFGAEPSRNHDPVGVFVDRVVSRYRQRVEIRDQKDVDPGMDSDPVLMSLADGQSKRVET